MRQVLVTLWESGGSVAAPEGRAEGKFLLGITLHRPTFAVDTTFPENSTARQLLLSPEEALGLNLEHLTLATEAAFPDWHPSVTCRGNTYSGLNIQEQLALLDQLLNHQHTLPGLEMEQYPLSHTNPSYFTAPPVNPSNPKARAVVLDCEMTGSKLPTGEYSQTVVALALIDFLSGRVLLNTLIQPTEPITDWRSRLTGITSTKMAVAVAEGRALRGGTPAAVTALWNHIDSETIIVGQSVKHDLHALGTVHTKIVDSGILAGEAFFKPGQKVAGRIPGLQTLCKGLVGIEIRQGGKGMHDALEDVLATREVVIWCLRNPAALKAWAERRFTAGPRKEKRTKKKTQKGTRRGRRTSRGGPVERRSGQ
ncbi:hypothetical protein VTI74DRAFT_8315 [Chaetomium olivicolor]